MSLFALTIGLSIMISRYFFSFNNGLSTKKGKFCRFVTTWSQIYRIYLFGHERPAIFNSNLNSILVFVKYPLVILKLICKLHHYSKSNIKEYLLKLLCHTKRLAPELPSYLGIIQQK